MNVNKVIYRLEKCGKSAVKRTNISSRSRHNPMYCGMITCPVCTKHRENTYAHHYSWINSGMYDIRVYKTNYIYYECDVDDSFEELHKISEELHDKKTFYRVALGRNNLYLISLKSESRDVSHLPEETFDVFIHDYVNFSDIQSKLAKENLLFDYHRKKRMIGKGKCPSVSKEICVPTAKEAGQHVTKYYALYSTKKIISTEDAINQKIEPSVNIPLRKAIFEIEIDGKVTEVSFQDFLYMKLQADGTLESKISDDVEIDVAMQWVDYFDFKFSKRFKDYLHYLYNNHSGYDFLEVLFK